ncbi:hypothetical protein [Microbacterium alcoholitolerans]|uniref:hypothetical protein n=1 Tax=unclassified Microbacterium TaxID=2609290 RepID=UPI003D170EF9
MSGHVDSDPFWSVVRRRHPDLDIVVLPPAPPRPAESGGPLRAPEPFAEAHLAQAHAVWAEIIGHRMPQSTPKCTTRWIPGPTRDAVRHTATLTIDDVDGASGLEHLNGVPEPLIADRWRVFAPPTGMPRITADRDGDASDGDLGDEHLLIGYAPEARRLFARLTSAGIPVGVPRAQQLTGGRT